MIYSSLISKRMNIFSLKQYAKITDTLIYCKYLMQKRIELNTESRPSVNAL